MNKSGKRKVFFVKAQKLGENDLRKKLNRVPASANSCQISSDSSPIRRVSLESPRSLTNSWPRHGNSSPRDAKLRQRIKSSRVRAQNGATVPSPSVNIGDFSSTLTGDCRTSVLLRDSGSDTRTIPGSSSSSTRTTGNFGAACSHGDYLKNSSLPGVGQKRSVEKDRDSPTVSSTYKRMKCDDKVDQHNSTQQSRNRTPALPVKHGLGEFHSSVLEANKSSENAYPTSVQRRQQEEMPQPMSYTCVKKMCEEVSPEDTASKLCQESMFRRFEALLVKGQEMRYDLMKLVVSLIEIVSRSRTESQTNKVFALIQKTNFWESLSKFVGELFSAKEALSDSVLPSLMTNLCKIFNISLDRLPDLYSRIPISQLKDAVGFFKEDGKLEDTAVIDVLLENLNAKRQRIMKEKREKAFAQQQPPNDFRTLSVVPTRDDIFSKGKPFLRENLVDRPFSSVEHYLDIQFRLLKEDSLADLRNGIRNLTKQDRRNELQVDSSITTNLENQKTDIKVYYNVMINEVVTSKHLVNGIVRNVSFDVKHPSIKRTNWARSKRLMFGSLVCLLSGDFQKIYFATVQNRTAEMLGEGYLQLCFEGDEVPVPEFDDFQVRYRMVESSSAYFVAYRHILKQLQEIKTENMPFKNYIIDCQREVKQPAYLRQSRADEHRKTIDLSSIAQTTELANVKERSLDALKNVNPSDLSTWPDGRVIGLNESQYSAFQSAIRKEFAVIQGPPGTGKTYLGLKIADALLANRHLWKVDDEESPCPILMLAYTNHALDQFLEGLSLSKQDIVRVGGRSSSENLKECFINAVRRKKRDEEKSRYGMTLANKRRLYEVERSLEDCNTRLNRHTNVFSQSNKGILPVHVFADHMEPTHREVLDEEDMAKFLYVEFKNHAQDENALDVEEDDEFDGLKDREGHFSAARFMPLDDKTEKNTKSDKFVICYAEETKNPKKLKYELNQLQHLGYAFGLEKRTTTARDLLNLNERQRWCLYRLWLARLHEDLNRKVREEQTQHFELSSEREELRNIEDLSILRGARVVGMTTTWAAKNHKLLRQLRPRIVVIEEAAEVFEGHVVSCLTEYCQHLILIGDHQQLRPNPSVYKSVKYSLDVSLLERMIRAGVPYNRLAVQHRMRPEISQVMRHIYKDLEDHTSVIDYENVKGISKNLYFIDHCEQEGVRDNVHSKTNAHEAGFLVALFHYLLRQGYRSSQVTILTTYTGQMFEIRDLMKKSEDWRSYGMQPPRVTSVDNYQGEENDIILLSLVRNNEEGNIGFLKINNRVCVALSRARKGLYIIGNREILTKQSPLWKSVLDDFQKNDRIGQSLPLVCSNHENENLVSNEKDFAEKVPNGGCLEPCRYRLECGHTCPHTCHPDGHESFRCQKPCERSPVGCELPDHKCTQLCCEPCDLKCQYPVEKFLKCGHLATLACNVNINFARCQERCEETLPCGHQCQSKCSAPCTEKCLELVKTSDWPCGHVNTIACSATPKDCPVPCGALLSCGHKCPGKCGSCIQGRVHVKCKKICERSLICSHVCKASCTKNCPPCSKKCMRKCDHSKCERLCGEVCIPCKEPCQWECEHFKCTKLCSEMCNRPRCDKPCNRKLNCGRGKPHYCRGLCGECCVCVLCPQKNGQDIREIFFGTEDDENARFIRLKDCEHVFEYTGLDRWMDDYESEEGIKPKVCPLCKKPVEKSWRYGNVVRNIRRDIDNVKRKVLGSEADLEKKKILVDQLIIEVASLTASVRFNQNKTWKKIMDYATSSSSVHYQNMQLLESLLLLVKSWVFLKKNYDDAVHDCVEWCKSPGHLQFEDEMENIRSRIIVQPSSVDPRILEDLRLELERMSLKSDVMVLKASLERTKTSLKEVDNELVKEAKNSLGGTAIVKEEYIEEFKSQIRDIRSRYPQLSPITEMEKVQIVEAIGLKQGHWFKCPQGHYYAIGECGGAMEKSRCPECGAVIGGEQHRLQDDNQLAPEMDGAQHPAWSEGANLANYQMEDV